MQLYASGSGASSGLLIALCVIGGLIYYGYHIHLFFCRPEEWAARQRHKRELQLAAAEEARAKQKTAAGNLLGGFIKAAIEAAVKKR